MASDAVDALKTMTATEAKTHFGQLLESSRQAPVVVERQGKPVAVVVSAEQYDLLAAGNSPSWRDLAARSRTMVRDALGDQRLPDVVESIAAARDERDGERDRLR